MSRTSVRSILGAVLVGGRSTRFGRPKWSEPLAGVPMARRAADALAPHAREVVAVAPAGMSVDLDLEVISDAHGGAGPLAGVVAALERAVAAGDAGCAVVACDLPLVDARLVGALVGLWGEEDVVAPENEGRLQPLCSLWSVAALPAARAALASTDRSLTRLAERLVLRPVPEAVWRAVTPAAEPLLNVNTPADLVRATGLVLRGGAPEGRKG